MSTILTFPNIEIKIPAYITCLSQEEIDKLRIEGNLNEKVIGAGVHVDGTVTLVLASAQIRIFDPVQYFIPVGPYIPQADGHTVFLPNVSNRWPTPTRGFSVQSTWLVKRSQTALSGSELFVNKRSLGKFEIFE